jgi:hypothetical protein
MLKSSYSSAISYLSRFRPKNPNPIARQTFCPNPLTRHPFMRRHKPDACLARHVANPTEKYHSTVVFEIEPSKIEFGLPTYVTPHNEIVILDGQCMSVFETKINDRDWGFLIC